MHDMTAANLRSAYGGESMAHMRYRTWAGKAEKDGFPNVARLFRAIAFAEEVHANNHFATLADEAGGYLVASGAGFGLAATSENLQGAIDGEMFEVAEMYPTYKQTAEFQDEKKAVVSFNYALEAEKIHARMYQDAKQVVDAGDDIELGPVQICDNCGYTHEGDMPDKCPVCKLGPDRFRTFA